MKNLLGCRGVAQCTCLGRVERRGGTQPIPRGPVGDMVFRPMPCSGGAAGGEGKAGSEGPLGDRVFRPMVNGKHGPHNRRGGKEKQPKLCTNPALHPMMQKPNVKTNYK